MPRIHPLPPPQRMPLDALSSDVQQSLLRVGEAYMLYDKARVQFEKAAEQLEQWRDRVEAAVERRDRMMSAIAKAHELEDGHWRYDPERGALVGEVDDER